MSDSKDEKTRRPGRQPGTPKTGGRKPGTPNKNSWNLRKAIEESGYDVVGELIKILEETTDQDTKFQRLTWLFRYLFPQLKETEQPAESETPAPATTESSEKLMALIKN